MCRNNDSLAKFEFVYLSVYGDICLSVNDLDVCVKRRVFLCHFFSGGKRGNGDIPRRLFYDGPAYHGMRHVLDDFNNDVSQFLLHFRTTHLFTFIFAIYE